MHTDQTHEQWREMALELDRQLALTFTGIDTQEEAREAGRRARATVTRSITLATAQGERGADQNTRKLMNRVKSGMYPAASAAVKSGMENLAEAAGPKAGTTATQRRVALEATLWGKRAAALYVSAQAVRIARGWTEILLNAALVRSNASGTTENLDLSGTLEYQQDRETRDATAYMQVASALDMAQQAMNERARLNLQALRECAGAGNPDREH